jgi:processive 1,2-diacylglycerol beta-glucosyltransferase
MTRILILTAGYGDGHNTAAYNLRDALETVEPGVEVEVVDLLRYSYGWVDSAARHCYHHMLNCAPRVWGGLFRALHRAARSSRATTPLARAARDLGDLVQSSRPHAIVSTYPAYTGLMHAVARNGRGRSCPFGVVITDSVTINAAWYVGSPDFFCVPNPETAAVLAAEGVEPHRIHPFGFPVSARFAAKGNPADDWEPGQALRLLYVLNHGTRKGIKTVRRLLNLPEVHLTVVAGRNERLRAKAYHATAGHRDRVEVMGWTDALPDRMRQAHLVITKAGGATLQECLAAGKPVILSQVVPGQEQGNAELVLSAGMGAVAPGPKAVARSVETALGHRGLVYRQWRRAVERHRRPTAAREIARFVLQQCAESAPVPGRSLVPFQRGPATVSVRTRARCVLHVVQPLLCDFHTHSTFSDGRLNLAELVDLHGRQGFDVLCVTDHVADPGQWLGRWGKRLRLAMDPRQLAEYFEALERERRRAWNRYRLILLCGLEFNRPAVRQRAGSRLLAVGLQVPVDPTLPWEQLIPAIHDQGGLVVAPYAQRTAWLEGPTLRMSDASPSDQGTPRSVDAWEIRGLNIALAATKPSPLPLLATGNFHQPEHLRSWKTLVFCERQPDRVLDCLRHNQHLGLAFFGGPGTSLRAPFPPGDCAPQISAAAVTSLTEDVLVVPAVDLVPAT